MNIFFSLSQLIVQFENPNFIVELKSISHTHTDLSYRQVYLHHVKTCLHTINIRENKMHPTSLQAKTEMTSNWS